MMQCNMACCDQFFLPCSACLRLRSKAVSACLAREGLEANAEHKPKYGPGAAWLYVTVGKTVTAKRLKRTPSQHGTVKCHRSYTTAHKREKQAQEVDRLRTQNRKLRSLATQKCGELKKLRGVLGKCKTNLEANNETIQQLKSEVTSQTRKIDELQMQILTSQMQMFVLRMDERKSYSYTMKLNVPSWS